mgnify:CR=1 FL=1
MDAVTGRAFGEGREVKVHGFLSMAISVVRGATAAVLILLLLLVQARAFWAFEAHVVNVTAEIHQINAPTATPAGDTYEEEVLVTLSVDDPTDIPLTIHSTLDASDPDCTSTEYISALLIDVNTTLKAIACDAAEHKSIITEEIYEIIVVGGGATAAGFLPFTIESEISETPTTTPTTTPLLQEVPTSTPALPEAPLFPAVPTTTPTTTLPLFDFPAIPLIPTSTPTTTPDLPALPPIPDLFDTFPVPTTTPTSTLPEFGPIPPTPTSTLPEPLPPPEPPDIEIDRPQPPDLPVPPQPPDLTDTLKPPEPPDLPEPPEPPSFPEL